MRVMDLMAFIRAEIPGQYYANKLPPANEYVPAKCVSVTIHPGGGVDEWTGKKAPSFQLLVRGEVNGDPEAEARAYEIFNALANRKDVKIGADSLSIIRPVGSAPFYIGADDNNQPIYSMNFNTVIRP
ncbi:minor capsid protein [Shouchella patagoniensis]|uniref:minor capsid protein n=1 Tax=Shouchella patagoniensis TaxID=228576 RepID=UPI000994EF02|nr:minor capsid protein [Shouchella patagoniensis]